VLSQETRSGAGMSLHWTNLAHTGADTGSSHR